MSTQTIIQQPISVIKTTNEIALRNTEAEIFKYSEDNINKAISIVNSKFSDISKLNYQVVGTIGKAEYDQIEIKLASLTSTIDKMKTPGILHLIDELEKDINQAELGTIWNKACAIKPSVWSRLKSTFSSKKHVIDSINNQSDALFTQLKSNTGALNDKVNNLKKELYSKRSEQMVCIQVLQEGFSVYLDQLTELATQHLVTEVVKVKQEEHVNGLKTLQFRTPAEQKDLINSEAVLSSLINRELVIKKSIVQVPIIVQQYKVMIDACNSALQEIDNTLDGTFNSIRSNINTLGIAMKSQQALTSHDSTSQLDANLTNLTQSVVGQIATKAAILSSDTRIAESNQLENSIHSLLKLKDDLAIANEKQKQQYAEASEKLTEVARIINSEFNK